ncbi:MAG: hypothetical protein H6668_01550 [Ardenticatenaceae bacterium]|nr:hypothetical protein [Ardenticatenaceae bacterium]
MNEDLRQVVRLLHELHSDNEQVRLKAIEEAHVEQLTDGAILLALDTIRLTDANPQLRARAQAALRDLQGDVQLALHQYERLAPDRELVVNVLQALAAQQRTLDEMSQKVGCIYQVAIVLLILMILGVCSRTGLG